MKNLMKSEIMKLFKSLPLKIIFLLMILMSVITSISSLTYVDLTDTASLEISISGYDAFLSCLQDIPTIAIIGIMVIGLVVCTDFENRTIQMAIATGYSRREILISKIIAVTIGYLLVFLPYPLGRAILQGVLMGFGLPISIKVIIKMIVIYFIVILLGLSLNGITLLLAFIIRKSAIVMGASFVLTVLGGTALLSFGISTPNLGLVLSKIPLGLMKELSNKDYNNELLLYALFISIFFIIIFLLIINFSFRKAELK